MVVDIPILFSCYRPGWETNPRPRLILYLRKTGQVNWRNRLSLSKSGPRADVGYGRQPKASTPFTIWEPLIAVLSTTNIQTDIQKLVAVMQAQLPQWQGESQWLKWGAWSWALYSLLWFWPSARIRALTVLNIGQSCSASCHMHCSWKQQMLIRFYGVEDPDKRVPNGYERRQVATHGE